MPTIGSFVRSRPPSWFFLRGLGLIFATAFASLWTQIDGLIGPQGILPVHEALEAAEAAHPGLLRFWDTPTLLWLSQGALALHLLCALGLLAGTLLTVNLFPRLAAAISTLCFLSFVSVGQEFAHYQSDGMLLEAGLLAVFLAGPDKSAFSTSRAALWLLRWEWFRLYFESGFIKWVGGDPQWHALTALDRYYENGPLPTWLAWYAQQELPHSFHAACAALTLIVEIFAPLVLFLPWNRGWARRVRLVALALCTLLQLGILATANYAFINHLALVLGIVMLDEPRAEAAKAAHKPRIILARALVLTLFAAMLWTTLLKFPRAPIQSLPKIAFAPAQILEPFRVANRFGLFGRMTDARYELEFQGSLDGKTWTAYPFRRKPQEVNAAPGIYAPHQPRFDWNLWFASLGEWREAQWTLRVCEAILEQQAPVLKLFKSDPFAGKPPQQCRIVEYQYWFTTPAEKRATGAWWRREELGVWAPILAWKDGTLVALPAN